MYESYFGLARRPFAATPDPSCFVPVDTAREALEKLVRCAEVGQGIGILTAPAGMGKSLLCAKLIGQLADSFVPAYLPNANFPTRRSLLQAILYELGHPYIRMAEQELRLELITAAKKARDESGGVLLVVDEAHLLSAMLLEEIRTITNLVEAGEPLTRVILSGQLLLEEKLAAGGLEALNQRIACQVNLEPLSQHESIEYILARIKVVVGGVCEIFTADALEFIARASDGVPRCLNQLCDHSLLLGYASDVKPVGVQTVHDALEDLKHLPLHWNEPSPPRPPTEPDAHRPARSPSLAASPQNAGWSSCHSGGRPDGVTGSESEEVDRAADKTRTAFESIEIGSEPNPPSAEPVDAAPEANAAESADVGSGNEPVTDKETPGETPSAVFEVGRETVLNSGSAEGNDADGCPPGPTARSVQPGGMTEPSVEPAPVDSMGAAGSFVGATDAVVPERPHIEDVDTYRLIPPAESRSGDLESDLAEFEEEIIEDRYAQLDAGLIDNDNGLRSTPPQTSAPLTAGTDEPAKREDDSKAGTAVSDPHEETATTSTSVADAGADSAVTSIWRSVGGPDPVQIIDEVAPLLDEELRTQTGEFNTFDSLVMPAEIDPADCRIAAAESRISLPEPRLEQKSSQPAQDWLTANEAIVSLPIEFSETEPLAADGGLSDDSEKESSSDLDMPAQLIGFSALPAEELQNRQSDAVLQPGAVVLDAGLESSVESLGTGWSSAVSLPPRQFGDGPVAAIDQDMLAPRYGDPPARLPDTPNSRDVQELAATQQFDVLEPEAEPSANISNVPANPGRIPADNRESGADSPPAAPHSSRPHGRYGQLFSELRRRSSRPA